MSKGLDIINTKLKDKDNKFDRKVINCLNEFLFLIKEKELVIIEKELKALEIIKECLVSEFKFYEKNGEYFILFYFDKFHELEFKLKNKEEYDLLKEVLSWKII